MDRQTESGGNTTGGNGVHLQAPGFGVDVKGRWGGVLLLVVVTCALIVALVGYGMNELVKATNKGHDSILGLLDEIKATEEKSQCLQALPLDGEERIAALRSEYGPCYYVLYVYSARNVPAARPPRPRRPTPIPDASPLPPQNPPNRPTYPSSGFPASQP